MRKFFFLSDFMPHSIYLSVLSFFLISQFTFIRCSFLLCFLYSGIFLFTSFYCVFICLSLISFLFFLFGSCFQVLPLLFCTHNTKKQCQHQKLLINSSCCVSVSSFQAIGFTSVPPSILFCQLVNFLIKQPGC